MFKKICLLLLSVNLSFFITACAEESSELFPVYYKRGDHFSIANHDVYGEGNDPLFPVIRHKLYRVVDLGTQDVSEGRYRHVIQLIDPETGMEKIFRTRLVDPGHHSSRVTEVHASFESKVLSRYDVFLFEKYSLTLEDGGFIELRIFSSQSLSTPNPSFTFVKTGDTVFFLEEIPHDGFDRAGFKVDLYRDGQKISTFAPNMYGPMAIGPSRKIPEAHTVESNLLTLLQKDYRGGSEKYFIWSFEGIDHEWVLNRRTIPNAWVNIGDQFETIPQPDDNKLFLKLVGTDHIFQFMRVDGPLNSSMNMW